MVDYGGGNCLPEEIIFDEILSRIPAPIVFRFNRVCRRWRNTICSQGFAKIHLNRRRCSMPPRKLSVQFQRHQRGYRVSPPVLRSENGRFRCAAGVIFPADNDGGALYLLHSCDGLIVAQTSTFESKKQVWNICVLNPVISFIIRLPRLPIYVARAVLFLDDVVNKYKLLVWACYSTPQVHLFDFVDWCWKTFTIPMDMKHLRFCGKTEPLFSKGCLYWPDDSQGKGVLKLDLTSGDTSVIKFWYDIREVSGFDFRFLIIDGSLYGLQSHSSLGLEDWHIIWVLLPHNGSFEWAIYHRHGNLKPKPNKKLYLLPSFNNYSTALVSPVITTPPALLLHQFKLIYVTYEIEKSGATTAHMDTLVSLEVMMTPEP